MKIHKIRTTLALVGLLTVGTSQGFAQKQGAAAKMANISGEINIPEPVKYVYFRYMSGSSWKIDSAAVVNGKFTKKITLVDVAEAYAYVYQGTPRKMNSGELYLEPGNIKIRINGNMKEMQVEGSKAHKEYELLATQKKAVSREEFAAKVYVPYILKNPESPIIANALTGVVGNWYEPKLENLEKAEQMYNNLPDAVKGRPTVKDFRRRLTAGLNTSVGRMAMDFKLNDTAGRPVTLSSFRGKYVLLDFWASWCVPCRANNPKLIKVWNEFKDKNFMVLGIAFDRTNYKVWMDAIYKDKLPWINLIDTTYPDNSSVGSLYNVGSIPQNVLVDPDGKIIAKNVEGDDLPEKLKELLAK